DEIVRLCSEVELREDAAYHVELHPFAVRRPAPAYKTEGVPDTDRTDVRSFTRRIVQGTKGAAQETHERSRFLGIGEQWAEDLVLRKEHHAFRLGLMNSCAAAGRADRLRLSRRHAEERRDDEGDREVMWKPMRHVVPLFLDRGHPVDD